MIANFHTHTPRCNHASGTEEEYVRCALQAGLQTLGFSDHTPYPFPGGFVSSFRMAVSELPGYAQAVRDVQQAYKDRIDIHLGVEAEFYPKYFPDLLSLLRDNGVEYMILGQHMLGNEIDEPNGCQPNGGEEKLIRHCNQAIDAMQTGMFTYLAHPDLFYYTGDWAVYQRHMRRLCREAKACNFPLELNMLGLRENKHYPNTRFLEVAAEEGCTFILGRDAHHPFMLTEQDVEQNARQLLQSFGITPIETIELVHI